MDRLNQWLSLIANVGVLAGIAFLVVEINQNTAALHSSTFQDTTDALNAINMGIATDPDLIRVLTTPEPLNAEDRARYNFLMLSLFRVRETAYYQQHAGTTARQSWMRMEISIENNLKSARTLEWWKDNAYGFTPEFSAFIDRKIEHMGAEQEE